MVSISLAVENVDDPTRLLEKQIQFAEATMGARFSKVSAEETRNEQLRSGLELMREQDAGVDETVFKAEFERLSEESERLRERKLSLDQLVEFTTEEFRGLLSSRNIEHDSTAGDKEAIDYILSICENPEFTAIALVNSARTSPDPVRDLKETQGAAVEAVRSMDAAPRAN
jgi:hypothetical protein